MPKIPTRIVKPKPEPEEGETYKIKSAESIETTLQKFKGIRVVFQPVNKKGVDTDPEHEHATMLWSKEEASETSKLGAFILVLGDDSDAWIGKVVRFADWRQKHRQIEVVK